MKCYWCGNPITEEESNKFSESCANCYEIFRRELSEKKRRTIQEMVENPTPIIAINENGKPYYACYLPIMLEAVEVASKKHKGKELKIYVDFGETILKRTGNLIGIAGFYYDSKCYGVTTPEKVVEAWNWFNRKAKVKKSYWREIERETAWDFIDNNWNPFANKFRDTLVVDILSLIVDLHVLDSLKVDVDEKLSEIRGKIRGNIRAYEKLSRRDEFSTGDDAIRDAFLRVTNLRKDLAHLASESRLARLAKQYGFDVKLAVHPDLTINGKEIDVKTLEEKYIVPKKRDSPFTFISDESTVIEDLSNPVREGFKQKVDIVAIEVDHLEIREIKGFKSKWLGAIEDLKTVLQDAVNYDKKGTVLLFKESSEGYSGRIIRCWEKRAR